jgi:hypothetical protein
VLFWAVDVQLGQNLFDIPTKRKLLASSLAE